MTTTQDPLSLAIDGLRRSSTALADVLSLMRAPASVPALAAPEPEAPSVDTIDSLRARIRELEQTNASLTQRVEELEPPMNHADRILESYIKLGLHPGPDCKCTFCFIGNLGVRLSSGPAL